MESRNRRGESFGSQYTRHARRSSRTALTTVLTVALLLAGGASCDASTAPEPRGSFVLAVDAPATDTLRGSAQLREGCGIIANLPTLVLATADSSYVVYVSVPLPAAYGAYPIRRQITATTATGTVFVRSSPGGPTTVFWLDSGRIALGRGDEEARYGGSLEATGSNDAGTTITLRDGLFADVPVIPPPRDVMCIDAAAG